MKPGLLRYPGGKTHLAPVLAAILQRERGLTHLAEPFCGGASVSLYLLENNLIQTVALNDLDPRVSALWQVVFGHTTSAQRDFRWLLKQVREHPITLEAWHTIKDAPLPRKRRELAWSCLFLNRTSFNGIMTRRAGPIGGKSQEKNQVDVRFTRTRLEARLKELHALRARVLEVRCEPWITFVERQTSPNALIYLDPPYYHRGAALYTHAFTDTQHTELAGWAAQQAGPFVVSYDDACEIRALYPPHGGLSIEVIQKAYSNTTSGGRTHAGQELMISNIWGTQREDSVHVKFIGQARQTPGPETGTLRLPLHAALKRT